MRTRMYFAALFWALLLAACGGGGSGNENEEDGIVDDCSQFGDECDSDEDGIVNHEDSCPWNADPSDTDSDGDGFGDACDLCPEERNADANCDDAGDVCSPNESEGFGTNVPTPVARQDYEAHLEFEARTKSCQPAVFQPSEDPCEGLDDDCECDPLYEDCEPDPEECDPLFERCDEEPAPTPPTRENCPDAWAVQEEPSGWATPPDLPGGLIGPVHFEVTEGCALIATTGEGDRLEEHPYNPDRYVFLREEMEHPRLLLTEDVDWVVEYWPAAAVR